MYLIYIVFILNLGYKNTIYVEWKVNGKHEHPPVLPLRNLSKILSIKKLGN